MSGSSIVWRVNRTPRFPVLSLGEYVVADDKRRETMRRSMKYERIAPTLIYNKVRSAVASFLSSPTRDRKILARYRGEIESARDAAPTPTAADNATYALRALEAFENSLNALPLRAAHLERVAPVRPRVVEGVKVSIQPTALIHVARPRGKDLLGAIVVDTAKGIEAKSDEMKARATEVMIQASMLLHEHVADLAAERGVKPSPEHCMIFHSYRQELVACPRNYRTQLRIIEATCRGICGAWEAIAPPPNFDPALARYRA